MTDHGEMARREFANQGMTSSHDFMRAKASAPMPTEALYDRIGRGYRNVRRPDPRLAAAIWRALGDARTVLNVGAGAGSYEPRDRWVLAVEPSSVMIAQRPAADFRIVVARDAVSGIYERGEEELSDIGVSIRRTEEIVAELAKQRADLRSQGVPLR